MQTHAQSLNQESVPASMTAKQEHPVKADEGFDTRVHIRDRQTGRLVRLQHYALHCFGDTKMFEQPIGSGNMYDQGGNPIGRWELKGEGKNKRWTQVSEDHEHIEQIFYPDREAYLDAENQKLRDELAAIKAEQESKLHTESHEPKNVAKAQAQHIPDIPGDPGHTEPKITIGDSGPKPVTAAAKKK